MQVTINRTTITLLLVVALMLAFGAGLAVDRAFAPRHTTVTQCTPDGFLHPCP